jgi:crotonobetainyl-CoA:carnitine CoA-transferase CaiB-like acyl-CoA transferase
MGTSDQTLNQIKVLDFTHVLAGPFCTYQLAVMGADVIKIESRDLPDMMRFNGPSAELCERDMSLHYQAQAANKRSLSLNLKHPDAISVLDRLIDQADVLVVNYRKKAAQKLLIDYERAKNINPSIIYCSMTGFGQTGPKADHAAYDNVIQAFSGLMAATGTPDGPMRVGPPVLDYGTGAQAALAITSSLFQRERTGGGNFIDIAMLDAAMMLMSSMVTDTAISAEPPKRVGNRSARASYGCYKTLDGDLMIGAYTKTQMINLWRALGCQEKAASVEALEHKYIDAAISEDSNFLQSVLLTQSAAVWEQRLIQADVPAARVRTLNETLIEPQVQARAAVQSVSLSGDKSLHAVPELSVPVAAWQSENSSPKVTTAPPTVGEHTEEILTELGFTQTQINNYCVEGGPTA